MDPVTLATVSIGSTLIGGLTTAVGAAYTGMAQNRMYNYQAGVSQINANIAKQNADYERYLGEVKAQDVGMKVRSRIGALEASQGASGIDVKSGSSQEVQESALALGQHDEATTRSNAARKAYGYDVEAMNKTAEAGLYRAAATTSETSGFLKAGGSLIGTGGSVADKWYQYSEAFGTEA